MADLVAIDMPAGRSFLEAMVDVWARGDAVLPLPQQAPMAHRAELTRDMGARWTLTAGGRTEHRHHRPVEPGDALVMATSGTTGAPKGVVLTHAAVTRSAHMTAGAAAADRWSHWVACLPLSHVGGLSVITRALVTSAALSIHDRFDPQLLQEALRDGATHVSLVPTALRRIDADAWQRILLGGSAIPEQRPDNCTATYGMTETFGGIVYDGVALEGVEVRIAHENEARPGTPAPGTRTLGTGGAPSGGPPVEGPVQVRSPTLLRCYRGPLGGDAGDRRGRDTDHPDRDPLDTDGWFTTGDIGTLSPDDGHLEISGRADDMIITGGEKVWPAPVEERLEAHPLVGQAAVVGRPDDEWGQLVTALVVPLKATDPPDLVALREWVRQTMPAAAAPKVLELRDSLPRTAVGKIARARLG